MATNNNLLKRLRREISSSPKKAAVLGISLLIAAWFWAPLMGKWLGAKPADEAATTPAAAEEAIATISTPTPTAGKPALPKWHEVLQWIRNDRLMQPHIAKANERDPFSPSASMVANSKATQAATAPIQELTPQQAGLSLRSTVVGARTKTALINGRAYHEHQTVRAANGRDQFVIVEIRRDSVMFERNGKSFELKLPRVEATSTEE